MTTWPRGADFRRFRRFRPWMWGRLRHLWVMDWDPQVGAFTHYRRRTEQDQETFARLDQCCEEPSGRPCTTHRARSEYL